MEKRIADLVVHITKRISIEKDHIKRLERMQGKRLRIRTEDCPDAILVPHEVREEVFTLVKTSYEKELMNLEQQIMDL